MGVTKGGAGVSNLDLHRRNMEEAHRAHDVLRAHRRAFNEAAVKSGEVILRTCLLINGGAAIAVLAFMGNVIAKDPSSHRLLADVSGGLNDFFFGVGFAVIAMGLTYVDHLLNWKHAISQKEVWKPPYIELGKGTVFWGGVKNGVHVTTVVLVVLSVVMFVLGLVSVEHAADS
jgi:hypothetical protein